MDNKRWQNLAFGLAFTLPVIGAYIANRLVSKYRNRAHGIKPEVTRIRVPLTSLIGLNTETVVPKSQVIVLPAVTEIELEQDTLVEDDATHEQFIASTERGKFHRPECRYALNIKPENSLFFKNKVNAQAQGFTPCGACNP